jgi:hypothetical protein
MRRLFAASAIYESQSRPDPDVYSLSRRVTDRAAQLLHGPTLATARGV